MSEEATLSISLVEMDETLSSNAPFEQLRKSRLNDVKGLSLGHRTSCF